MPEPAPLAVMSFNIRYGTANDGLDHWKVRKERTFEVLRRHPSHILSLQEALDFQIDEILEALPGYASLGVGRDDARRRGEFSPILYDTARLKPLRSDTFWFSDTPHVPGSRHWGNQITRICTWAFFQDMETGSHFFVYNLHLDHQSQPSRERSVDLLLQRISERGTDDPVVVTGDFNVDEDNPAIDKMRAAGFRDTFRVVHPDAKDVGTFNAFQPEFRPEKIDHIFVDRHWSVDTAAILRDRFDGRWPSDHAPVTFRGHAVLECASLLALSEGDR
jgi:endonuclease/exonuclease/phosphatase family metal-dependent hydrolase